MSSRDIAILLIVIPILIYCLAIKSVRSSLWMALKLVFGTKLIFIFLVPIVFVISINSMIDNTELQFLVYKISTLWVLFNAIPTIMNYEKIISGDHNLKYQIIKHLKISTLIVLFVNSTDRYVLINVILIVFTSLLHLMIEFMKSNRDYANDEYNDTKSVLNYMLIGIGIYLITETSYQVLSNINNYLNTSMLIKFVLPFIYSSLFIPFVYAIGSCITLESQINRNGFIISNNDKLLRFLNRQTIINFIFSPEKIDRFNKELWKQSTNNKEAIMLIIRKTLNGKR